LGSGLPIPPGLAYSANGGFHGDLHALMLGIVTLVMIIVLLDQLRGGLIGLGGTV